MTAWLDRLNLQPNERRIVLVGMVVIALLLNYWLIWPHFSEWGKVSVEMAKAQLQSSNYMSEIKNKGRYEAKQKELQGIGATILPADQDNSVQSKITTQAAASGVTILNMQKVNTLGVGLLNRSGLAVTNQFFDEVSMNVEVNAGEKELIDFLYSLGSGDSFLRVREIVNLRLDGSKTKLQSRLNLVASFQRKPPEKPVKTVTNTVDRVAAPTVQSKGPASTNKPAKK